MSAAAPLLSFETLHDSALVSVRTWSCRDCGTGMGHEERSETNDVVLLRRGAFRKHFGRRSVTADVNQAVFFSRGSTYRVSHPAGNGDAGAILRVAPRVLHEIVRECDPSLEDPARPFPFVAGPCDASAWWRHHELVRGLSGRQRGDRLWADCTALQLAADVLEAAFRRHGRDGARQRRRATQEDHAAMAEAAQAWLAREHRRRITLEEVAAVVHCSPFHFARVFERHAGLPLHRYVVRLRLRSALAEIAGGAADLADLALRLGFSSHAHLTDSFRREFGRTPSEVRRLAALQESKDLEA